MEPIKMPNPIVEMDGDEMTRILWGMIKDELIRPFVELNTEYYDLCLPNRDETDDARSPLQAAEAIKRLDDGREVRHHHPQPPARWRSTSLNKMWKSPNATIRAALDGTVFRAPILISKRVKPGGVLLEKAHHHRPPRLRRHVQGGGVPRPRRREGRAGLHRRERPGAEPARPSSTSRAPACCRAMHNRDDSILSFARCCFTYALDVGQDVWFSTKDTISKDYDQTFKLLFQKVYDEELQGSFDQAGLTYRYALIDDVAAKVIRSEGGIDLGLQELRRRRDERPGRRRLRLPAHDDQRAGFPGRQLRV